MTLILLSGLGADAAVFAPQQLAFPNLVVPAWNEPLPSETLAAYAERMVQQLGTIDEHTWIGGASFGGIVALHMAEYTQPKGVVLLGSVRRPSELPLYARVARRVRWCVPLIPVRLLQVTLMPLMMLVAGKRWPRMYGLAWQFSRANPRVVRWSIARLLEWNRAPVVHCPVLHIHGERDFILPAKLTTPDHIIRDGGHIVSLTHPQEVNEYLLSNIFCQIESDKTSMTKRE